MRNREFISDYYRVQQKHIETKILNETDETILYSDTEELVEYYFSHHSLAPIEFDPERQPSFAPRKWVQTVPAHRREEFYRSEGDVDFEYEGIDITFPIIPNHNSGDIIFRLASSPHLLSSEPVVSVGDDALYMRIDIKGYGFKYDDDQVANEVNGAVEKVRQWIGWKNNDIANENTNLKRYIHNFITERKTKLNADSQRLVSLVQKINIPLKQKENEAVSRIKLNPKPLVKRIKPNPQLPEEYTLDRPKVMDVISIIDNQGFQFEKTPKTYKDSEEEDLRNVILVNLNTIFEGKATGETFSQKGKTDIYLNIDKGNILICECKIWGGQALYKKTIDQLLGYLTWRHNFGIMITFVKQKNFSKILSGIPTIVQQHISYRSGFHQNATHHFLSHHVLPHDEDKNVEVHHLFYNLYNVQP